MAGIPLNAQFEIGAAVPIDNRLVLTKAQMLAIDDDTMPDVYGAWCTDDKKAYVYNKSNTPSDTTGKFQLAASEDEEARSLAASAMSVATSATDKASVAENLAASAMSVATDARDKAYESIDASDINYSNSQSSLSASNVQSAIDEVNAKVDELPSPVTPKGTIAFAFLPSLDSVEVGWMYNISDDFTTTSDFVIPDISESAGSNVYCIDTGSGIKKWDVFAAGGGTIVVDQTYNASSTNAQSGTAVAEAIVNSSTAMSRVHLKSKLNACWTPKSWSGLPETSYGQYIWNDGTNIYYSEGSNQYVLDINTNTWSAKTWYGLTEFNGDHIWANDTNLYYSDGDTQYVKRIDSSTWTAKSWSGLTSFNGSNIWTDGTNIYYSEGSSQYVLNNSTWSAKTWYGLTEFNGSNIWTDGINIYYSSGDTQYVLDLTTSTWSVKTWFGLTNFYGSDIWIAGIDIYCRRTYNYILNISTSTWSRVSIGSTDMYGSSVWTDGTNIYSNYAIYHYVFNRPTYIR